MTNKLQKKFDKTQYEIHFLATMTHKEINDQLQVHMLIEKELNKDIVLNLQHSGRFTSKFV